jgi:hypothetical protein
MPLGFGLLPLTPMKKVASGTEVPLGPPTTLFTTVNFEVVDRSEAIGAWAVVSGGGCVGEVVSGGGCVGEVVSGGGCVGEVVSGGGWLVGCCCARTCFIVDVNNNNDANGPDKRRRIEIHITTTIDKIRVRLPIVILLSPLSSCVIYQTYKLIKVANSS